MAAREALITDIDRQRDLNAQLAGELQVAQQKLLETVANLRSGRPVDPVAVPFAAFRGALDWPVTGTVRTRFGRPSAQATPGVSTGRVADEAAVLIIPSQRRSRRIYSHETHREIAARIEQLTVGNAFVQTPEMQQGVVVHMQSSEL